MIKDVLKESIRVTKNFWRRQFLAVLAFIIAMIITYYAAFMRRDFIDLIVSVISSKSPNPLVKHKLIVLGVLLIILWVAGYLTNFLGEYLLQSLGPLTLRVLAEKFTETIHRVRPSEALKKGDLLARFTSDAPYLSDLLGGLVPALLIQIIRLGIGAFILYKLCVPLTILAIALTPLYYAIFRFTSKRIAKASEEERKALSSVTESMKLSLDNLNFIRATLTIDYFKRSISRSIKTWMNRLLKLLFYRVFFTQTFHSVYYVVSLVILIVGGYMAYLKLTTVGTLIAFTGVMYNLYEPIINLSNMFTHMAASTPYLRRYREVISLATEDENLGVDLKDVNNIKLNNVVVELHGHKILKGINLNLKKGSFIGIVGPSGAGKTTLLLTLIRFFEPTKGSVIINGSDYRKYNLRSLRNRIRYVSSREPLFEGTVLENVTLGLRCKVSEKRIRDILEMCRVNFVKDLHDVISPNKLSEGQKQRLVLARALLSNPDVLLLDEALNAVDAITEDAILRSIKKELRNKIVIVVSHRATALKHTDMIYVIDAGTIKDKGTHTELFEHCDLYRDLITRQQVRA